MRFQPLIPLLPFLALACTGGGNGNGNDTDDSDTGPSYDPGCILVDGDGGYAFLNDAIEVADEGSTITLCDIVEEEVVVDKAVTIEGDGMTLKPPVNVPAVRVAEGGDLTLADIVVETTRSAFVVEGGGRLDVSGADLAAVPNYGVDVQPEGEAIIDATTFNLPLWGAARVAGGSLTLTNSDLVLRGTSATDSANVGVIVEDNGVARLENNTLGGAWRKDTSQDLFSLDGNAVQVKTGGTAELSGNTIAPNDTAAILVNNGTVTLDGDAMQGGLGGIVGRNAAITATDIDIVDYTQWGVVCVQCDPVELDSATVTTTPDNSLPNSPPSADQPQGARGSQGILGIESVVTITGSPEDPSVISGHNGAGIVVSPSQAGDISELNISDAIVEDNTANGIAVYNGELTMTDTTVRNTRTDESYCLTETGYQCDMAVGLWSSNGTFTNATVEDSGRWGIAVVGGALEMTGGRVSRNELYGVFAQAGSVVIDGTSFTEGRQYGVGLLQGSSGVIENASFEGGSFTSEFTYMSGEDEIRNVSYYRAQDVFVSDATLVLNDSTFTDGERGISASSEGTTLTTENLTFTRYNQWPVYTSSGADVELVNTTMSEIGRQAIYCFRSDVTLDGFQLDTTTTGKSLTEVYRNGELDDTFESEFADEAMYFSTCDLSIENGRISDTTGQAIYGSNTSLDVDGLELSNIFSNPEGGSGSAALDLRWSRRETDGSLDPRSVPTAIVNDLQIESVQARSGIETDAIRMNGWAESDGTLPDSIIQVRGLTLGDTDAGIAGDGLEASTLADLTIDGLSATGIGQNALNLTRVGLTLDGDEAGGTGRIDAPGLNGIAFSDTTPDGATARTLTVQDLTIASPGVDGLSLENGVDHSLVNVTVSDAGEWGATCEAVTFATCDADLAGALGAHQGCDACDAVD